jgi:hypothetical protein
MREPRDAGLGDGLRASAAALARRRSRAPRAGASRRGGFFLRAGAGLRSPAALGMRRQFLPQPFDEERIKNRTSL